MSQYTVTTNFAAKDSLISGNPAKLILGAQLTAEYNNIATAIATKVDGAVGGTFFPDGSVGQPSVGFTNNAGTGMYNNAGVLSFSTGSTLRAALGTTGGWQLGSPTGGDKGVSTLNAAGNLYVNGVPLYQTGSFTGTLTGMTGSVTATVTYVIAGNTCTITTPAAFDGTSNTTAMTMTGLPAACQTASLSPIALCLVEDNNNNVIGSAALTPASGTVTFLRVVLATGALSASGFTASGTKGLNKTSFTYSLL